MSNQNYDHKIIEPKWQKFWEENKTFKANDNSKKSKFYALDMFPYPSGAGLHVGHPEGYTATDIISRKKRMEGYEVLHPMGWDAFGLPAVNYAIKTGTHPRETTMQNIETFKKQIKSLGFSYDWDREIDSTDLNYYKWTQWIFLQLFNSYFDQEEKKAKPIAELREKFEKDGTFASKTEKEKNAILVDYRLAYEKEAPINFCPSCKTGLANEEVVDGKCERCGAEVARKNLRQWILRITDYAERLLNDLKPTKVLIIHGFEGSADGSFKPWLKKELEKKGFEVILPNLPNTNHPNFQETMDFLENQISDFNENDIIVGHSLGAHFALKLAEKRKFNKIILIAPVNKNLPFNDYRKKWQNSDVDSLEKTICDNPVNFDNIKTNKKIAIFSEDDDIIPIENSNLFNKDWEIIKLKNYGHFSDIEKFEEILPLFADVEKNILNWPYKIKAMQENWIGKSEGAEVDFEVLETKERIRIYTTRPDTLFGATYFVLSPEHPLVKKITTDEQKKEVEKYITETAKKSDLQRTDLAKEKTGVFTGGYVINPVNNEKLPVWIADYVLMGYGTGAIMAVPAHDERDFEFAKKYNIPLKLSIRPQDEDRWQKVKDFEECFTDYGILINSEKFNGLTSQEAKIKIAEYLESKNKAKRKINYKLRDWIFSRQRYWGEPIPVVHCEKCGIVVVDEKDLPIKLPDVKKYEPSGTGESPLVNITDWVKCKCSKCQSDAKRETNTMPQWAGSSWYWLRFMDAKNDKIFCDAEKEMFWGPVDLYVGGAEHAVLHLLYSRFWHKVLYDLGYVSTVEPFKALMNQGMILAENGEKMSKSRGNVVNPDEIVEKYGSDTLRIYEMFMGPFEQAKAWNTNAVEGIYKWLQRIFKLYTEKKLVECKNGCDEKFGSLPNTLHKTIKKVTQDIDNFKFNTAISQMMIFINEAQKHDSLPKDAMVIFCKLISPFAPHLAEEIWHEIFGNQNTIAYEKWPIWDENLTKDDQIEMAIQINGKLRATITVDANITKEDALKFAKENENIQKWLEQKEIIKEIFVQGKIVNLVVK